MSTKKKELKPPRHGGKLSHTVRITVIGFTGLKVNTDWEHHYEEILRQSKKNKKGDSMPNVPTVEDLRGFMTISFDGSNSLISSLSQPFTRSHSVIDHNAESFEILGISDAIEKYETVWTSSSNTDNGTNVSPKSNKKVPLLSNVLSFDVDLQKLNNATEISKDFQICFGVTTSSSGFKTADCEFGLPLGFATIPLNLEESYLGDEVTNVPVRIQDAADDIHGFNLISLKDGSYLGVKKSNHGMFGKKNKDVYFSNPSKNDITAFKSKYTIESVENGANFQLMVEVIDKSTGLQLGSESKTNTVMKSVNSNLFRTPPKSLSLIRTNTPDVALIDSCENEDVDETGALDAKSQSVTFSDEDQVITIRRDVTTSSRSLDFERSDEDSHDEDEESHDEDEDDEFSDDEDHFSFSIAGHQLRVANPVSRGCSAGNFTWSTNGVKSVRDALTELTNKDEIPKTITHGKMSKNSPQGVSEFEDDKSEIKNLARRLNFGERQTSLKDVVVNALNCQVPALQRNRYSSDPIEVTVSLSRSKSQESFDYENDQVRKDTDVVLSAMTDQRYKTDPIELALSLSRSKSEESFEYGSHQPKKEFPVRRCEV
jgi:hypothetical protein